MGETNSVLSFSDVSLAYRTKRGPLLALEGLTFDVHDGEFVSVLGPSGCGKSTLLKIGAGLLQPTGGTVTLAGTNVVAPRADVGVVFQKPSLMPWKTVLENVLVAARSLGLDMAEARRVAIEYLDLVGLGKFKQNYPGELSGGMQQRVGLVRGLVHDPTVLLMDEPFAALDAMTRETMTLELQKLWMSTSKSVLFITHSIPEAVFLSDRVIVLSERPGHVVTELVVGLKRPRGFETMSSKRFVDASNELRSHFSSFLSGQ